MVTGELSPPLSNGNVKTDNYPPPPLRSSPLSQGDKANGKVKSETSNINNRINILQNIILPSIEGGVRGRVLILWKQQR